MQILNETYGELQFVQIDHNGNENVILTIAQGATENFTDNLNNNDIRAHIVNEGAQDVFAPRNGTFRVNGNGVYRAEAIVNDVVELQFNLNARRKILHRATFPELI